MNEAEKATPPKTQTNNPSQIYEIVIEGHVDTTWSEWFDDMAISHDGNNQTLITGAVSDQTALIGLLLKVHHLGLTLVSVNRYQISGLRYQQERS